jgi:acetyl esterase/lipase
MLKRIFTTLLFAYVSLHFFELKAQPDLNTQKVDRNVVFGMYSGLALVMDIYYPENPNGYGIVHISGSGWTKPLSLDAQMLNHQSHIKYEGQALLDAGYTLFGINHRAVPRFIYPAAVEDAQRAVRFIRFNAEKYGIKADRIGAVGGSSGGHLVSMLGTLNGDEFLDDDTPVNRMSAKVQTVIARAAPSDFTTESRVGESFISVSGQPKQDSTTEEFKRAKEASPITYVSADDAPILLVHGDQDNIVPISLSEDFQNKFKAANVPCELIVVEGAGHGPSFPGATNMPDLGAEYVKWMDKYLKK